MELDESPTTKGLQTKHSHRPVGGVEAASRGGEDSQQEGGWRTGTGEAALADRWLVDQARQQLQSEG